VDNGKAKAPEEGWCIWFIADKDGDAFAIVEKKDGSLIQVWAGNVTFIK
jgi:hypothetical protein